MWVDWYCNTANLVWVNLHKVVMTENQSVQQLNLVVCNQFDWSFEQRHKIMEHLEKIDFYFLYRAISLHRAFPDNHFYKYETSVDCHSFEFLMSFWFHFRFEKKTLAFRISRYSISDTTDCEMNRALIGSFDWPIRGEQHFKTDGSHVSKFGPEGGRWITFVWMLIELSLVGLCASWESHVCFLCTTCWFL